MTITPINCAEAIIEPFWDPQLSGLSEWVIAPGQAHGLQVRQNWCWAEFEWARKPAVGPALRMSRSIDLDCSAYDNLVVSVMAPHQSILRITATTERGTVTFQSPPAPQLKKEYAVNLGGAQKLVAVTLEIDATEDGVAAGWFNWVGLQNSALLPRYQAQWDRFGAEWQPYLKSPDYEPAFQPSLGLLMDVAELGSLRQRHAAFEREHGASPFTRDSEKTRQFVPEKMVRDFVNFWGDTRYCRERDYGNTLLGNGPIGLASQAAIAGVLLRDKELLRLSARFALALVMCGRWDDGMICYFPGSTFEHRCFVQSLCVQEIAIALDLAGECFTDIGRDLLMRRIAEEGLGAINFNTWKHDYIFHCNQLAWFTPGRMLGYTALEQSWPRVKPYTELAYQDLIESLGYAILPDGGYVEGPTYFRCVGRDGGLSLFYYARARGKELRSVIPESMLRTAPFSAAIASTDESADQIPICDASPTADQESLAVMAAALPASQWVSMFRKSAARTAGIPSSLLALQLEAQIPPVGVEPEPFVHLPDMGVMASTRKVGSATIKLLLMGNKAGAGHTHEDKGSFVLEFAGETFAMDPGTCDYSSPLAEILTHCERHNMLIPLGTSERPHPACPLPADVKPAGMGDATVFNASVDVTAGWDAYYRKWQRQWHSPSPDVLVIRDEWELAPGGGEAVEFYWQTRRDISVNGHTLTLRGQRGNVVIEAPSDATLRIDELPLLDGTLQHRIAIGYAAVTGSREVQVRMALR